MKRRVVVSSVGALMCSALLLFGFSAPVRAQGPYPTGACDVYFIEEGMNSHASLIALSQMAVMISQNPDVQDFAQALIDEQWVLQHRIGYLATLPTRQLAVPDHLMILPAPMPQPNMVPDPEFDVVYLRSAIAMLQRQLAFYERESRHDPCTFMDIMEFANNRLPLVRERLRLARLLLADVM
jgi:hypothetical protein